MSAPTLIFRLCDEDEDDRLSPPDDGDLVEAVEGSSTSTPLDGWGDVEGLEDLPGPKPYGPATAPLSQITDDEEPLRDASAFLFGEHLRGSGFLARDRARRRADRVRLAGGLALSRWSRIWMVALVVGAAAVVVGITHHVQPVGQGTTRPQSVATAAADANTGVSLPASVSLPTSGRRRPSPPPAVALARRVRSRPSHPRRPARAARRRRAQAHKVASARPVPAPPATVAPSAQPVQTPPPASPPAAAGVALRTPAAQPASQSAASAEFSFER